MPQIFISYAREDREFAVKLAEDLRRCGIDVWIDIVNIRAGEPWDQAIEHALTTCSDMLIVLSPDAVSSASVMDELAYALDEGKRVVPLLHRACRVPLRIKRLQYVDFTASYGDGLAALRSSFGYASPPSSPQIVAIQQPAVTSSDDPVPKVSVPRPTTPDLTTRTFSSIRPSVAKLSRGRSALLGAAFGGLSVFAVVFTIIYYQQDSSIKEGFMWAGVWAGVGAGPWALVGALVMGDRRRTQWGIGSSVLAVGITWLAMQQAIGLLLGMMATGPVAAVIGVLIVRRGQRNVGATPRSAT